MYPRHAIIFSGGGTLGSVSPLIAVMEQWRVAYPCIPVVWVGTRRGIERSYLGGYRIPFFPLCGGKFRRYFSLNTLLDSLLIVFGFFQAMFILLLIRPIAVVSAGSFIAVPLHVAAWLLHIPALAIQLDASLGLANRLMAPFSSHLTSAFPMTVKKCLSIAIPVRHAIRSVRNDRNALKTNAIHVFGLRADALTLLVMGGGTGAVTLNRMMRRIIPQLIPLCNIIHLTGIYDTDVPLPSPGYFTAPFLGDNFPMALAVADLVVSRAGMGAIAECAFLQLPMIVVPLPHSAQEENAEYLLARGAVDVVAQRDIASDYLHAQCVMLLDQRDARTHRGRLLAHAVPTDGGESVIERIQEICHV